MKKVLVYLIVPTLLFSLISTAALFHSRQVAAQQLSPEEEAALRAQLQQIEKEIAQQQAILTQKQGEGASLQRDISILDAKIKEAQLKIKAHNLAIDKLGKDITIKIEVINGLEDKISQSHQSIADILRKTNEIDNYSLAEAFLAKRNLSDFFLDVDSFNSLQNSLKTYLDDVKQNKDQTETEKQDLNQKRNKEIDTKINVEEEKAKIQKSENEKARLLTLNKQEQKNYQTVISEKQAQAAEIRNRLFPLRDSPDIKFGQALQYANDVSNVTGIRPAFLLAIITQESNLGKNIGSCYLTDESTGAGVRSSTGAPVTNVMKPSRDVAPFLNITKILGRDPHKTLVSCPFQIGYGGAMGPAQFIPSTWMLMKDKIAAAVGKNFPDPWSPRDAFMASALYLRDLGAVAGSYTAERNAACKYYSGSSCGGSNTFYGDQVMAKATSIQADIEVLDDQ